MLFSKEILGSLILHFKSPNIIFLFNRNMDIPTLHPDSVPDLKCSICLEFLNQALSTKCGHLFCCSCLVSWLDSKRGIEYWLDGVPNSTCPVCRSDLDIFETMLMPSLDNIVSSLLFPCPNLCGKYLKLKEIKENTHLCSNLTTCPSEKCNLVIPKHLLSTHLLLCPFSVFRCGTCQEPFYHKDYFNHLPQCIAKHKTFKVATLL